MLLGGNIGKCLLVAVAACGTVACSGRVQAGSTQIWGPHATSATLDVKGGLQGKDETFTYTTPPPQLELACRQFCYLNGSPQNTPYEHFLHLLPSDDSKVRQQLAALEKSTDRSVCAADAYDRKLTIASSSGNHVTYLDSSTAGCPGVSTTAPVVAQGGLDALQSLFESLAAQ